MNQFSDHGAASIREGGGGRLNLSSRLQVEKRNDQYKAINSVRSFHTIRSTYLPTCSAWVVWWVGCSRGVGELSEKTST